MSFLSPTLVSDFDISCAGLKRKRLSRHRRLVIFFACDGGWLIWD